tara:strand:+ start:579 stop:731 length:153 start_codon:yes stop_codon:yes gene_type:complete
MFDKFLDRFGKKRYVIPAAIILVILIIYFVTAFYMNALDQGVLSSGKKPG